MKRRPRIPGTRNPIAKAARKIRPKIVPDTRRKKREHAEKREINQDIAPDQ